MALETAVQQRLYGVVEHKLLSHEVVVHPSQCGRGWVGDPFKNAPLHDCHITDTFPLHKAVTQRYSPGMTTYGYIRTSRIFSKSAALPKGRNGDTSYTLTPMPLLRHRQSNSEVSP